MVCLDKKACTKRDEQMKKKCAGCRKSKCDGCSLFTGVRMQSSKEQTVIFPPGFEIQPKKGLGIAFDVGTTTVAGALWDLEDGKRLAVESCVNPQRYIGSDVVSRMVYSRRGGLQEREIRKILVKAMDEMAQRLTEAGQQPEKGVTQVTVAGNTAMGEILFGIDLEGLMAAPFHKEYQGCMLRRGSELGFTFLSSAEMILLPAIEGFVGADALCVYTWVKKNDSGSNVLAVDIGTNGEMILLGEHESYACSTAAGPALEGAAVSQGMGAAPGAIEEVGIVGSFPRQDIHCKTIGDTAPIGICGSGLVDALAVLRRLNVIDETGYLKSKEEAARTGVPPAVCQRLGISEGENRILLTNEESPVYLNAGDVRQLQLAKAAIRAGIRILLEKAGIDESQVSRLYLAGAFGSYIRVESALATGLLPSLPVERVVAIGNCAGMGAAMALLSQDIRKEMEADSNAVRHVELAQELGFQEAFLEFMRMP